MGLALLAGEAFAEEGGADADLRGAFFNGDGEIAAHAHGKDGKMEAGVGLELAAEFAEVGKVGARFFRVGRVGGDGHETTEGEAREGVDFLGKGAGGGRGAAELGAFAGDVDLEEDVLDFGEGFGAMVDFLGEFGAVDRINGIKEADGVLGLVGLEMADQVPDAAAEFLDLAAGFLDFVFAEADDAGAHGFLDGGDGLRLADGNEFNFVGIAPGLVSGGGKGGLKLSQSNRKIVHQVSLSPKTASVIPQRRLLTGH